MNIFDLTLQIIEHVISLITTPPVSYLFYTILLVWVFALFFKIVRG